MVNDRRKYSRLTVREENTAACKFYEKVGMELVGSISWAKGKMPGSVWRKEKWSE